MTTPIETEDLRALFDLVVKSMDFGSGFFDGEEADLLRKIAVTLGVDPMEATPSNVASQYPHTYKPKAYDHSVCAWDCGRSLDSAVHGDSGAQVVAEWLAALADEQLDSQITDHEARLSRGPEGFRLFTTPFGIDEARAERLTSALARLVAERQRRTGAVS